MFGSRMTVGVRRGLASTWMAAALLTQAAGAQAAGGPSIRADRGCYLVGETVQITGAGFARGREFDLAVDGVDFGQSTTTPTGAFEVRLGLGSLHGVAQHVEALSVTDGSSEADGRVTLTAGAGARFLSTRGSAGSLRAPIEVWGFSPNGPRRPVFLHYLSPSGNVRRTVSLGRTGGQCGYLLTGSRRVFPFTPSPGSWRLQIDTQSAYAARPSGPVARFSVRVV